MKKTYSGIVSSGSVFHSNYLAKGLERHKLLSKYIVGNHKNINLDVDKNKVINIKLQNYIGYLIRKIPFIGHKLPDNIVTDNMFDMIACRKIDTSDFFVGFNNYSLKQMELMKRKRKLVFLDQRIAHVNTEIKLSSQYLGYIPQNLNKSIVKRKLKEYEIADYIFVGSNFVAETFIENNIRPEKVIIVPYGYNPENFYCYDYEKKIKNNNRLKLVFVGQIGLRKGVNYLLEAYDELIVEGYNIELVLAGNIDSKFKSEFMKYSDKVIYKGYLNNNQLRDLYNDSDAMVFPSLWEGSARVLYDAAACGAVIITSRNSGSIIENLQDGIILNEISVENIKKSIKMIYEDRELLSKLRKNSLKKINKYTWDKYGDRIGEAILQKLEK